MEEIERLMAEALRLLKEVRGFQSGAWTYSVTEWERAYIDITGAFSHLHKKDA